MDLHLCLVEGEVYICNQAVTKIQVLILLLERKKLRDVDKQLSARFQRNLHIHQSHQHLVFYI